MKEFPISRKINMVKPSETKQDFETIKMILKTCQEFSKCYVYMNVLELIQRICEFWDNLSECYEAGKDLIQKRLEKLKKKDPLIIKNFQLLQEEYKGENC